MIKTICWLSILLFVSVIPLAPGTIEQTHARARGCCMQLAPNGRYYPNGLSFNQCRSANGPDNDDLYSPSGRFWWNVNC